MKNRSIKGIIVKDLLNLSHYKFSLLIIIIVFTGIGFANQNTLTFLPIMLMTMIGMIGLSTFSYDEISKADKYLLTLPTNKKELIKAKYLLIITMILLGAIISFVAVVAINYIMYKEKINLSSIFAMLGGGFFGISLVMAIQIPSIYKWGAEKGKIQMFVLVIIVAALTGGVIYLVTKSGLGLQLNIEGMLEIIKKFGTIFAFVIIIIMYVLSYKISYKIFSKKDL